jgi:hypothetical protein
MMKSDSDSLNYDDLSNEQVRLLLLHRFPQIGVDGSLVTDYNRQTMIAFVELCSYTSEKSLARIYEDFKSCR